MKLKPSGFNPKELCNKNCNERVIRARRYDRAAKRKLQAWRFCCSLPGSNHHPAFVLLRALPALQWAPAIPSQPQHQVKPGWKAIKMKLRDKIHQRPFFYKMCFMLEGCGRTSCVACAMRLSATENPQL